MAILRILWAGRVNNRRRLIDPIIQRNHREGFLPFRARGPDWIDFAPTGTARATRSCVLRCFRAGRRSLPRSA